MKMRDWTEMLLGTGNSMFRSLPCIFVLSSFVFTYNLSYTGIYFVFGHHDTDPQCMIFVCLELFHLKCICMYTQE